MIPKIICFLFGHIKWQKGVSDKQIKDNKENHCMVYFSWVEYEYCYRCGVKFNKKKGEDK